MEGSFSSSHQLAFSVNVMADFTTEVLNAYRSNNQARIKLLTTNDTTHFDVFLCINSSWHASVLCVPVGNPSEDPLLPPTLAKLPDNPFEIPDQLFCFTFELRFEIEKERMYKIQRRAQMFHDIKPKIKRSFFIARYAGVNGNGLQFAALRASPKRYRVLLDDCVEFSKAFCVELMAYCTNYRDIEKQVNKNVEQATASGLSVEHLSRRVTSLGYSGNSFLSSFDISHYFSSRHSAVVMAAIIVLFLLYPVFVAWLAVTFWCGR